MTRIKLASPSEWKRPQLPKRTLKSTIDVPNSGAETACLHLSSLLWPFTYITPLKLTSLRSMFTRTPSARQLTVKSGFPKSVGVGGVLVNIDLKDVNLNGVMYVKGHNFQ